MHQTAKLLSFLFLLLVVSDAQSQEITRLSIIGKIKVAIPEPSDICSTTEANNFIVVIDHGILFRVNSEGKIIAEAKERGADFEGVCIWNKKIYVSEESFRKIMVYDLATLAFEYAVPLQYSGGRNEGFEAISRNEIKNCFVLISEKNPSLIFETDDDFKVIHEYKSPVEEVSSATFYKGSLYVLSDESHKVYKLNPENYSIIKTYNIPVINPEGICFTPEDEMYILSDDRAMIFRFKSVSP